MPSYIRLGLEIIKSFFEQLAEVEIISVEDHGSQVWVFGYQWEE